MIYVDVRTLVNCELVVARGVHGSDGSYNPLLACGGYNVVRGRLFLRACVARFYLLDGTAVWRDWYDLRHSR